MDRKVIRYIGCLRGKDSAEEVQIVERTTSIKEAVRGFAENPASEMPCVRHGRGWRSLWRRGEVLGRGKAKN